MNKVLFTVTCLMVLTSCYKEVEVADGDKELFELSVSPSTQELLFHSTDTSYSIMDEELELRYKGRHLFVRRMGIRGETALDFRRKSYSVGLEYPFAVKEREGGGDKVLESFKLISLAMDYTYINNRLAFGMLQKAGIMPLFYRFTELCLNGETQGVYFLVEDPEEYTQDLGSEYILRRDYNHNINSFEHKPGNHDVDAETYREYYKEIYRSLPLLEGQALYEHLTQRLDLDQYFRKMGVDYLLQNGDYTDEVFLYATMDQDDIIFRIIPWDYDDIFSANPHEVGRSWGTGTLFGSRSYSNRAEVLDEIGDKLIFSIEDDLDYAIAMDPFVYEKYESSLRELFAELDETFITSLFSDLEKELTPYYEDPDLILQSQYDQRPTDLQSWHDNMDEKESFVLERLTQIKRKLQLL